MFDLKMINQDDLYQVASISGGSTSHYMIQVLIEKYGKDKVKFIYCDTGAEHPDTYKFIKDTAHHFGIEITCIRLVMPKERGKGGRYVEVPIEGLSQDFKAFRSLMEKYGRPFMPSGKFCTDQMKTQIYKKWCKDNFGDGNYVTWIGYRDEPRDSSRVWGHSLSGSLSKRFGISQFWQGDFYKDCREELLNNGAKACYDFIYDTYVDHTDKDIEDWVKKVYSRVVKRYETNYRFLFEISNFNKKDILAWWDEQEFKLDIPPQCGNCVFCIEKSTNQLCYLVASQPEQANLWKIELDNPNIPVKEGRKMAQDVVYRGGLTFDNIIEISKTKPLEEWENLMGIETKLTPCASGECSVFGDGED